MNYQNGKIYKIVSNLTDKIYIGSTCSPLYKRHYEHKNNYKRFLNGSFHYITSFEILKFDHSDMQLVESYPCNSKEELHAREGMHIKQNDCVNKSLPGRTHDEKLEKIKEITKLYREVNKEKIKEINKLYREVNKEKIKKSVKLYKEENKEQINEYLKLYKEENKEKIHERERLYRELNKEKIKERKKLYCAANKEKIKERRKKYYEATKKHKLT
jgi:hypothetical protein